MYTKQFKKSKEKRQPRYDQCKDVLFSYGEIIKEFRDYIILII